MKRIRFASLLVCAVLLTSCQVGVRRNGKCIGYLPWYIFWVPLVLICLVIALITWRVRVNRDYRCPICQTEFTPKWHEFSVLISDKADRYVCRCPNCRRKGFCRKL